MKLFQRAALFPFSSFFFSLILFICGILVAAFPGEFYSSIRTILGVGVLLCSLLEFIFCFSRKDRPFLLVMTAFFSFFLAVGGVVILLFPERVLPIFIPAAGLLFTVVASFRLKQILELRERAGFLYAFCLLLSVLSILSAFFLGRTDSADGYFLPIFCASLICAGLLGMFTSGLHFSCRLAATDFGEDEKKPRRVRRERKKAMRQEKNREGFFSRVRAFFRRLFARLFGKKGKAGLPVPADETPSAPTENRENTSAVILPHDKSDS